MNNRGILIAIAVFACLILTVVVVESLDASELRQDCVMANGEALLADEPGADVPYQRDCD